MQQELGRDPTNEEIAIEMDFLDAEDAEVVRKAMEDDMPPRSPMWSAGWSGHRPRWKIQRLSQEPPSLQAPVGNEDNSYLTSLLSPTKMIRVRSIRLAATCSKSRWKRFWTN
ncbi:MAG: hypothetical protein R2911_44585 [Caldilineaceae bacterium]